MLPTMLNFSSSDMGRVDFFFAVVCALVLRGDVCVCVCVCSPNQGPVRPNICLVRRDMWFLSPIIACYRP